uniref:VWFA domain-containing protein n=1 Tax=Macrostomum lignano TaxID=282301 RepID=A0A1I8GPA0_9PLAT
MGRVITAVRNHIQSIIRANKRFNNYVIATYGDPYRRNVLKTRNAHQALAFLRRVRPHGGGDCPEMALQGVRDAAAAADRNSVLFLFTDASAKDAHLQSSVASLLSSKNIRFFTVASGNLCGRPGNVYKSLATRTRGRFSKLGNAYTKSVMHFIRKAVSGHYSFSVFPRNAGELRRVMSGRCGCRVVRHYKCRGGGGKKPKPPRKCRRGERVSFRRRKVCSCKPVAPRPGKRGSLIFVVDDTGSMGRVITARFNNYVLGTYGDPYRRNVLKTRNAHQALAFLRRVRPHGGGDCPEMALQGVRDAAAAADRNSVLF